MNTQRSLLFYLLCFCLGAGRGMFAAGAPAPSLAPVNEEKKEIAYRLSKTDKLSISIVGETDASLNVAGKRVDVNGNIYLALVENVRVAGLTLSEARTAIENAYKDGRFIRNPQVVINIEEYAPRTVTVGGLVKFGGTIPLPPETVMTLKDLISKVQLQETANAKAVRISRILPDGSPIVFVKNVDGIMSAKTNANLADGAFIIEPDDTIFVPEKIF